MKPSSDHCSRCAREAEAKAVKAKVDEKFQMDVAFYILAENAKRARELYDAGDKLGARWMLEAVRQNEVCARELWQESGDAPPLEEARQYAIKENI